MPMYVIQMNSHYQYDSAMKQIAAPWMNKRTAASEV